MKKQKIMGIALSALLFSAVAGTAITCPAERIAFADDSEGTETTQPVAPEEEGGEENAVTSLNLENTDLFLPNTYEQYLSLDAPSYMSMSEHYIVVADGTRLYIYDREQEKYFDYDAMMLTNNSVISTIQISDGEHLFFSAGIRLYQYNFSSGEAAPVDNVPCNTFLVEGDYLYTSYIAANSAVSLKRYPLVNISPSTEMEIITVPGVSTYSKLASWNGILYCVRNDSTISAYDISKMSPDSTGLISALVPLDNDIDRIEKISDIQRVCAYGGYLYYSVNGNKAYPNGLWRTDFKGNAQRLIEGEGFSAINSYQGKLYCIRNASVLELSVTDDGVSYTGYEIAASSPSENRLMDAVDAVRAGNLLLVADAGANRVTVYDQITQSYSVINCDFEPVYAATDGETIAVASKNEIFTCTVANRELVSLCKMTSNVNVQGLACIFGNVYYVTNNNGYGLNDEEPVIHNYDTPSKRLTADLYGTLYVSYADGSVRSFTEETFVSEQGGVDCGRVPQNHTSLRADFEGNLYCVSENKIYKNGEEFAIIDGHDFMYHLTVEGVDAPVSFALGFEDSEVYFFFKNHAVKSKQGALDIPTLDKIRTGDIAEEVFSVHGKENLFADIPAKTVGVAISLAELDGAKYFPYENYFRLTENSRGVLLGRAEHYCLALLSNGIRFTAALFRINEDYLVDEGYWTDADEETAGKRYFLSSGVSSYYAPCLEPALAELHLSRGTIVSVKGFAEAPDLEYALIEYRNEAGDDARITKTGYVPKSFLTSISPLPEESTQYLSVYLKASEEGILLTSEDGGELLVKDRTEAKAWKTDDGSYTVCVEQNGKYYLGTVDESQIDWQSANETLRIALIVILSVLALVIIGAYIFLLPRKKAATKKKRNAKERSK